jgi:hypothetical protein
MMRRKKEEEEEEKEEEGVPQYFKARPCLLMQT